MNMQDLGAKEGPNEVIFFLIFQLSPTKTHASVLFNLNRYNGNATSIQILSSALQEPKV